MGTTELVLAYDTAPDFLRLVTEPPTPRTPARQALADAVATVNLLAGSIARLEDQSRHAALTVEASRAALDVAEQEHLEARRLAAQDVLTMLKATPPRGQRVTDYTVTTISPDGAQPSGGATVGLVTARQAVEACEDMVSAATEAAAIVSRQLTEAIAEMGKLILARRDAVWKVVRADPAVARLRRLHADTGALLGMLRSMNCYPDDPEPEARPEAVAAWHGLLNALAEKPDTPLPDPLD